MTVEQREKIIIELSKLEFDMMNSKGKDYAGVLDTLSNFKRNAELTGLTKYQVWLIYFMKHIDSIVNAIKSNPISPLIATNSESLESRILDARVYLGLLKCLIEEDIIHFKGE